PSPQIVKRMIDQPFAVEQEGLSGPMVLDARGLDASGANGGVGSYAWYDQSIRNLEVMLKKAGQTDVTFDNAEPLLPNGTGKETAIYVGWYALRRHAPTCAFRPGAIGIHIASLELNWMRDPNDGSWCRGLLLDGADVTLGAINEPYLIAFPPADEFFPLLMTGKFTLADVYWITNPMMSWKVSLLGDPLYRPYASKPLIEASALPERLRTFVK
ncbi:MAG TPA: TIGR03790 family protein, partial [Tepidisphaeraceae bacterium]|nr:TIGR03790 family protein [Tepidisphaeraceae bacterium]